MDIKGGDFGEVYKCAKLYGVYSMHTYNTFIALNPK